MHHTDYRAKLRKAQHKSQKKWLSYKHSHNTADDPSRELVHAAIAAALVLVALLQMAPANAAPTFDTPGYGTLQLNSADKPLRATALSSTLEMVIHAEHTSLSVQQTFSNQSPHTLPAEYQLAMPKNATLRDWHILVDNDSGTNSESVIMIQNPRTQQQKQANRMLRILIPELKPDQQISVQLTIDLPTFALPVKTQTSSTMTAATSLQSVTPASSTSNVRLPKRTDNTDRLNSISAAVVLIGSKLNTRAFGALQPL